MQITWDTNSMGSTINQPEVQMQSLFSWAGILIWLWCRAGCSVRGPERDRPCPGPAVRAVHPG